MSDLKDSIYTVFKKNNMLCLYDISMTRHDDDDWRMIFMAKETNKKIVIYSKQTKQKKWWYGDQMMDRDVLFTQCPLTIRTTCYV